eukprot:comp17249_c0_seq1/m.16297 comp17249_c0_seq1/g.16297  ORF comp17249_c0_seq1/g.16297 comp17249_c0_seq1/m.16297 type:complete len:785 (-) comp17249_c0_seq1:262-2616(-)
MERTPLNQALAMGRWADEAIARGDLEKASQLHKKAADIYESLLGNLQFAGSAEAAYHLYRDHVRQAEILRRRLSLEEAVRKKARQASKERRESLKEPFREQQPIAGEGNQMASNRISPLIGAQTGANQALSAGGRPSAPDRRHPLPAGRNPALTDPPMVGLDQGEPSEAVWSVWQVLDTLLKKLPAVRSQEGPPPSDGLGSFFMVPSSGSPESATTPSMQRSQIRHQQIRRQLQYQKQFQQQLKQQSERKPTRPAAKPTVSTNTSPNLIPPKTQQNDGEVEGGPSEKVPPGKEKGVPPFVLMQQQQEECVKLLEAGIESREEAERVWRRLVESLSEQVRLLLLENSQLAQTVEETEQMRRGLSDFRINAEDQARKLKQSIMAASVYQHRPPQLASKFDEEKEALARENERLQGELSQIRQQNQQLAKERDYLVKRWEALRAEAKKKRESQQSPLPGRATTPTPMMFDKSGSPLPSQHRSSRDGVNNFQTSEPPTPTAISRHEPLQGRFSDGQQIISTATTATTPVRRSSLSSQTTQNMSPNPQISQISGVGAGSSSSVSLHTSGGPNTASGTISARSSDSVRRGSRPASSGVSLEKDGWKNPPARQVPGSAATISEGLEEYQTIESATVALGRSRRTSDPPDTTGGFFGAGASGGWVGGGTSATRDGARVGTAREGQTMSSVGTPGPSQTTPTTLQSSLTSSQITARGSFFPAPVYQSGHSSQTLGQSQTSDIYRSFDAGSSLYSSRGGGGMRTGLGDGLRGVGFFDPGQESEEESGESSVGYF